MPIYPVKCTCGYVGEAFAKVAELEDGKVPCPECGALAEQDYPSKRVFNGNREFRGKVQESITEGWHADEVGKVQREMAANGDADSANCIDAEGNVRFKDRQQQQRYMDAKARIWRKVADGPSQTMEEAQLVARAKVLRKREARRKALEKAGKIPPAKKTR